MNPLQRIATSLITAAFKIGAIKLRPTEPFTWASGWKSPIYNDNRMFLKYPESRRLITQGLKYLTENNSGMPDVIAGTSTAGIPHATSLANLLELPLIYIRDKPKDHGLQNQIEGIDSNSDLDGQEVTLIEDLVSTGGSSVNAVQAIRKAKGNIIHCFSIFSYGFPNAKQMFAGEIPFKGEEKLDRPCKIDSIIRYPELIAYGIENQYVSKEHAELLHNWSQDPQGWDKDWKAQHGTL